MSLEVPVNPWNVVAFFNNRPDGPPLYSPVDRMPPFQVYLPGKPLGTDTLRAINVETGVVTNFLLADTIERICTPEGIFYTHHGNPHLLFLSDGLYWLELTINNQVFYSQKICTTSEFSEIDYGITVMCSGAGLAITPYGNYGAGAQTRVFADVPTGGYVEIAGPGPTYVVTPAQMAAGIQEVRITVEVNYNNILYLGEYNYVVNWPGGCASGRLYVLSQTNNDTANLGHIEFWSDSDIDNTLLYQTGYRQRYYFRPYSRHPSTTNEEVYSENARLDQFLDSARIAHRVALDIYPIPGYLSSVLSSVRHYKNKNYMDRMTSMVEEMENYGFTTRGQPEGLYRVGTFSFETSELFFNACNANMTANAC